MFAIAFGGPIITKSGQVLVPRLLLKSGQVLVPSLPLNPQVPILNFFKGYVFFINLIPNNHQHIQDFISYYLNS